MNMNLTRKSLKVSLTVAVLAIAFGGLLYSTLSDGTEYFMHVDEVVANRPQWEGKTLQLHGYVVPGSILQRPNTLDYRFKVQSNGRTIEASYSGIVPDTFKDESEVVLRGELTPQGFQTARNGVTAKCPSKYVALDAAKKVG
jgi:cytochrome c-type biogenesis protein CcmE